MNSKAIYIPGTVHKLLQPLDSIIMNAFKGERKSIGFMPKLT